VGRVEFLHSGVGALLGQVRIAALMSSRFFERGAVGVVNKFGLADRLREAFPDPSPVVAGMLSPDQLSACLNWPAGNRST